MAFKGSAVRSRLPPLEYKNGSYFVGAILVLELSGLGTGGISLSSFRIWSFVFLILLGQKTRVN